MLDAGFEVLRFRAPVIVALLVLLHGPFFVASQLMSRIGGDGLGTWMLARHLWRALDGAPLTDADWWTLSAILVGLFGEMVFAVGLALLMRHWLGGDDPTATTVARSVVRRAPTIVVAWLIALVLKAVALALCGVGLIVAIPVLSLLGPVVAFEDGGPGRALRRTRQLGNSASSKALFISVTMGLLTLLIAAGLDVGQSVAVTNVEQFSTIMGIAVSLLLVVARCGATALLYLDVRVRSEGLDLALRAPDALGRP